MRIKKISPTTPANGNIENQYGTSQTNAYSEAYINSAIPTKTSQLTNDSNFATTDVATQSSNGLMSASDKSKLDNISYSSFVPTPSSYIEYNQSRVQKYGNIVVVSLSFNLKNTITNNTNIYSNLPSIDNILYGTIKSYNDNSARAVRILNGIIYSDEQLSAGWYSGQMTYIVN